MRLIAIGAVLLALLLGTGAVSYASYLPRYTVQTIRVSGAQHVAPEDVQRLIHDLLYPAHTHAFLSPANIFVYKSKSIEHAVGIEFPRVKSITTSRPTIFSTELDVSLAERDAFAQWCDTAQAATTSACYLLDDSGFIFAPLETDATTTDSIATPYVFRGSLSAPESSPIGQSFVSAHIPGITTFLNNLSQAKFTPEGAEVVDASDFFVPLKEGFYIKSSFGESASELVKNLELILSSDALTGQEENIEYIDLRFGDRVYYKLKSEIASSTRSQ